jgi:hypothetical protein
LYGDFKIMNDRDIKIYNKVIFNLNDPKFLLVDELDVKNRLKNQNKQIYSFRFINPTGVLPKVYLEESNYP